MNDYSHHIGDFRSGTFNMSRMERWMYRDLIDVYYDSEKPLSLDFEWVCYSISAHSEKERHIVANLLKFKFERTDEGYVHARCEKEIAAYRSKSEAAQENGKKGGRPKKSHEGEPEPEPTLTPEITNELPLGSDPVSIENPALTELNPVLTESEANQEPRTKNQEPRTKNQEPRTKNQEPRTKNQEPRTRRNKRAERGGLPVKTGFDRDKLLSLTGKPLID